ncbi:MAG: hypothetical protein EOO53_14200 [Gammaproteobacteria bacterium]|nr:MAG: hypothetical protein EOO53_14200 [Gammaproteobacteria bacterium]
MAKRPKRYLKEDYGSRKRQLPVSLEFLKGVKFHAIIEDHSGAKVVRTIEVKAPSLKALIEKIKKHESEVEDLEQRCSELELEVTSLKSEYHEINSDYESLKVEFEKIFHNYKILYSRSEVGPDEKYMPSPKSYFNIMNESGIQFNTKPMQGGHPSLGKRR